MNPCLNRLKASPPAISWRRALLAAVGARSLRQTVCAATIVGSVLFAVNLYSSVLDGPFTWVLASRIALTLLMPWLNATMGIAIVLRRPRPQFDGGLAGAHLSSNETDN